jgi:hypothetical protein
MRRSFKLFCWVSAFGPVAFGCSGADAPPDHTAGENGCGLSTRWEGDELCIAPPPPEQGFQVHYGPSNYDDPNDFDKYLLDPGAETDIDVPMTAGNTNDIYFYKRQYRMRPGSHHLIVSTTGAGSTLSAERRLGGSQNVSKDNPSGDIAPENVGIGMLLSANANLNLNLHHFNVGAEQILREAWVNFWYVDPASVTQEAKEMFLWATGPSLAPGESTVVLGRRAIEQDGRVLTMYGHRHSNNVRFSAYRVRAGTRELVYEDYDWEEPAVFEFNSLTTNPAPDPVDKIAGAYSGVLDLRVGDSLEWECEIVNARSITISFGQNEAITSEMCILVGDTVGPTLLDAP